MPKIVYIGSFKNLWDEEGIARSFEKIGVDVVRISEDTFNEKEAWFKIELEKPDLVLFAKFKVLGNRDSFIRRLKEKRIKTASWTFDLYFGMRRGYKITRDPMFKTDYVFSPDGGNDKEFKEAGVKHHLLRQGIFDEYCYAGEKDQEHDIIFVGCENRDWLPRIGLCKFLGDNFNFNWFGRFNTLEVRGDKLNNLYASAKIVIGDSVYSPYYWSNRLYETLGRGGFMFFPDIEGIRDEYKPYEHFIPYSLGNLKGLKEKIDYYLKRPKERERIGMAALEHTKENHTLINRCKQFCEITDLQHSVSGKL